MEYNECSNESKQVCVFTPSYDAFSFCFTSGALAHVNVEQVRAIHEAVNEERWQTARQLIEAVWRGTLSGIAFCISS